jgi:hypothetical protein
MKTSEAIDPSPAIPEVDPDQLLQAIEIQLAMRRNDRKSRGSRTAFRVVSLVVIALATLVALAVAQWMASQLPVHSVQASGEYSGK